MPRSASRTVAGSTVAWSLLLVLLVCQALLSLWASKTRSVALPERAGTDAKGGVLWQIGRRPELSFGFRNFLADVAWLEAVQVAGSRQMSPGDYDRLDDLLKITGGLDPRFDVPYILGAMILGNSPDHVGAALDTLKRGKAHHPAKWLFPFYIGYIQYFSLGDPVAGGKALEEAARIPGSPRYLPLLASRMLTEGREPETALALLEGILQQETDPARIRILEARIREVIVERDIQSLERAVSEYEARTGSRPANLHDLVRAGIVQGIPAEPHGGRYLLSPGGTVRSDKVEGRLKVMRHR